MGEFAIVDLGFFADEKGKKKSVNPTEYWETKENWRLTYWGYIYQPPRS